MRRALFCVGLIGMSVAASGQVQAQVTPDGTLNTTVTSAGNVFTITNGAARGSNLFHSFGQFSIPTNGAANFELGNTPGISTIFGRVTGGSPSSIDGTIRSLLNGNATSVNLFLMNPSGILFGAGARLQIGGSFVGTTADRIQFENGVELIATAIEPPLLTISAPIRLQLGLNPGSITQRSTNLAVQPGQGLALIGGTVSLEGGLVSAPSGRIDIAGIGANGSVILNNGILSYPANQAMQTVVMNQGAIARASGDGGGTIQVQGRQILMSQGAAITSDNTSGSNNGGVIRINATERLELDGTNATETVATNITGRVRAGTGQGSSIDLVAPLVQVTGGAQINSRTDAAGRSGDITIQAQALRLFGESLNGNFPTSIASRTEASATGRGGNVTITAGTMNILDGAELRASSRGNGDAGSMTIRAQELTTNSTPTTIATWTGISTSTRGGSGAGGDLLLEVDRLNVLGGSAIRSGTGGSGRAGNITIRAKAVTLQGEDVDGVQAQMFTRAESATTTGNAGNIEINTASLKVLDGAQLYTNTAGSGNAGSLLITAREFELIGSNLERTTPSTIQTAVAPGASGQGAQMTINVDRIRIAQGGQLTATTVGSGNAGNITLTARSIDIAGISEGGRMISGVVANSQNFFNPTTRQLVQTTGNAGIVTIKVDDLRVADGAAVQSLTANRGAAGGINVTAKTVEVTGSGVVTFRDPTGATVSREIPSALNANVDAQGSGQGGRVNLTVEQLRLTHGGQISSSTFSSGDGGDVRVQATTIDAIGTSESGRLASGLFANAVQGTGKGGNIELTANRLTIADGATINVGNFETRFPDLSPGQGATGGVQIQANTIALRGASIDSSAASSGNAGQITLAARSTELDQSRISTNTAGIGKAGQITLNSETIRLQNQSRLQSNTTDIGNAGQITLTSSLVSLQQSQISSQSTSSGNAGTLSIVAPTMTLDQGSTLTTEATGAGQAGSVFVQSNQISLRNNSEITSRSSGTGNGGTIEIWANRLFLGNNSALNAETASGDGGNIALNLVNLLSLSNQSVLSAQAGGTGNGGNITIRSDYILGAGNSDIIANAFQGRGGNIQITTQGIFGLAFRDLQDPRNVPTNDITASSQFSVNGTVQIDVLSVDPNSGLVELPNLLVDPSQQIAQGCRVDRGSRFVVTGRGGVPSNPLLEISHAPSVWSDLRVYSPSQTTAVQVPGRSDALLEASAWRRNPTTGTVELIAGQPIASDSTTCAF